MADQVGLVNFKGGEGEMGKALDKILDVITGGAMGRALGSAFGTWLNSKAQASSIRTISRAQTEAEIEKINRYKAVFGEEDGNTLMRAVALAKLQQANLDDIGERALKYINGPVSEDPISEDWKNDFIDKSKNINDSDIKEFWSKILAREVETPGRTSKRTLDVLYNLSVKEAEIFEKFCSIALYDLNNKNALIVNENFMNFDSFYHVFELSFLDLILMDEAGLIKSNSIMFRYSVDCVFEAGNLRMAFEKNDSIYFGCYKFTASGSELYKSIAIEPDERFKNVIESNRENILRSRGSTSKGS